MELRHIIAPIQGYMDQFEDDFRAMFRSNVEVIDRIADHMIRTKGKQLRPVLVLLSASAFGPPNINVIRTAAIVELIHTATLVHDDVVDEAPLRRGAPSLNSLWDNHIAVLMGDFLLAKALTLIVLLENETMMQKVALCTERLSKGELLQATKGFDIDITEEEYFEIIGDKTASLVASGCEVGAFFTSGSTEIADRFQCYGELLGQAFQITDDLLDYVGDATKTGKPTGHDIRGGTVTLPLIHSLQNAPDGKAAHIRQLMDGEWNPAAWEEISSFSHTYGGIAYARNKAHAIAERAKSHLADLTDTPVKQSLLAMVDYAVDRDR
ncbi:MAG: polyprenyl synthetase family protein [candidate division Zixibacteria bacterium]|nr:polyprenyl synthetase family protein [candidate division Zixibacteria bacterium]